MDRREFADFLSELARMYPRWAKVASSDAFSERLFECFAEFDAVDAIETARQMFRVDLDAEKPKLNDLAKILRRRRSEATRLDSFGVTVRNVRAATLAEANVDLARWTDCDVWRWWMYTAADWVTHCPLTGEEYASSWAREGAASRAYEFRGVMYSPSAQDRDALLSRFSALANKKHGNPQGAISW